MSAVELGNGMYNNTYRVDIGADRPVILRVAPEPARQYRIERGLMRNECASVPFLAPIAPLIPRTLAADFTHEILGRDYLFQTLLDGVSGPEGIGQYPRPAWTSFFRQIGKIRPQQCPGGSVSGAGGAMVVFLLLVDDGVRVA
ncbi:MAG: phosphotransferase family protein [Pseudonocardiaceae bacterium]